MYEIIKISILGGGGGEQWVGRSKDLNNKGYLVGTKGAGDAR